MIKTTFDQEKNHQCPLCPLKCYKRNTLKRHLEWHEKGKLTVNGTPKKPRILKRDKKDSPSDPLEREDHQPQSQVSQVDNKGSQWISTVRFNKHATKLTTLEGCHLRICDKSYNPT